MYFTGCLEQIYVPSCGYLFALSLEASIQSTITVPINKPYVLNKPWVILDKRLNQMQWNCRNGRGNSILDKWHWYHNVWDYVQDCSDDASPSRLMAYKTEE